ncbi:MAG: hypothetical protein K940chlam9_01893, partial [Chlamydiae bacterium]|nr:hypothetical protein [Chlamydiota bacterium]
DAMYQVLAYYIFTEITDPHKEVKNHKQFFKDRDVSGRIYISEEGINGQMSGSLEEAKSYMEWLRSDLRFARVKFKIDESSENIFPRMSVKYREQLVALDEKASAQEGGEHVPPAKWKEMLESGEYLVLDVRNDYESAIGHFKGAITPPLKTFREFPEYAQKLSEEVDPEKTKVMMYCTGGIRCELYSALLKKRGFQDVYQLDGGVIQYGLEEGSAHWEGKLFVFDDRLAIPIDGKEAVPISSCSFCEASSDTYYNCANMDCNTLFLACPSCVEEERGCCCESCKEVPRLRPFDPKAGNKPFRKKHLLMQECGCGG